MWAPSCYLRYLILLVVLLLPCSSRARTLKDSVALPDYSVYHHKDELLQEVAAIVAANSKSMTLQTFKQEAADREYAADMQVVDVEVGGRSNDTTKARLLLDFGEHGREYISAELGLALLRVLADPAHAARLVGGGARGKALVQLLQRVVFKIIPLENVGGRNLVESGRLCERKNGRGVDTNRNWPVDWGKKERDYDPQEEFPGKAPFSEPEVQILRDIAQQFRPHVWLNIHSGMEAMFTPWDHKAEVPTDASASLEMLQTIKKDLFTDSCVVGSGGKSVGYLAHGTATDYMWQEMHVPMAFTWEIYGDMAAPFNDCFRMFNPLTREHVQAIITQWLKAIMRLVELMPSHPAMANPSAGVVLSAAPGSKTSAGGAAGSDTSSLTTTTARTQGVHSGDTTAGSGGGAGLHVDVSSSKAAVEQLAQPTEQRVVGSKLGSNEGMVAHGGAAASTVVEGNITFVVMHAFKGPVWGGPAHTWWWWARLALGLVGVCMVGLLVHRYYGRWGPMGSKTAHGSSDGSSSGVGSSLLPLVADVESAASSRSSRVQSWGAAAAAVTQPSTRPLSQQLVGGGASVASWRA